MASLVDQEVTNQERLYPACLPTKTRTSNEGFHSGWSKPMPSDFLSKNAPRFLKVEEEFRKQQVDHKICFEKPPILNMSLCLLSSKSICSNTEWKLWIVVMILTILMNLDFPFNIQPTHTSLQVYEKVAVGRKYPCSRPL